MAPLEDQAKALAAQLLEDIDEREIGKAFEYLRWAHKAWPTHNADQLLDDVMKHCTDACRQAVVDVLKRGIPGEE